MSVESTLGRENERSRLYLGDALELLPTFPADFFDAIVTDPPYCSGSMAMSERARRASVKYVQSRQQLRWPKFERERSADLMEDLLWIVEPGGRVVDPFAGSGTMLLTALHRGLGFIGIEVSPQYYQIALERLQNAIEGSRV